MGDHGGTQKLQWMQKKYGDVFTVLFQTPKLFTRR